MQIITRALESLGFANSDTSSTNSPDGILSRENSLSTKGIDKLNTQDSTGRRFSCGNVKWTMREKQFKARIEELEHEMAALKSNLKVITEKYQILNDSKRGESLERREKEDLWVDIAALKRKHSSELAEKDVQIKKLEAKVQFIWEEAQVLEKHAQKLRKNNESLLAKIRTVEHNATSKLHTIEGDLQVANSYRRQVKVLEAKESQIMGNVEALQSEVQTLANYKAMYEEQLNRVAELEQEIQIIPSLKQQVEDYKKSMISLRVQGLGANSRCNDHSMTQLQEELVAIQSEKSSIERKLDDAQQDIQQLEDILKKVQQTSKVENLKESMLIAKCERYKRRITNLEAEICRTVSKMKYNETLDSLDTQRRLVEQLSNKLSAQSEILKRERRREEEQDRQVIVELEKKNEHLKDLLANIERNKVHTSAKLKAIEKEKALVIRTKEQDYELHIKELQERFLKENEVHIREQRLMMSAIYSCPFNINLNI